MFTILWKPLAVDRLAEIWLRNPALRDRLTELVEQIDSTLGRNPLEQGESRSGATRVLIVDFLVLFFDVIRADSRVEILTVAEW